MSRYLQEINLQSENSLSTIVKNIKPGSKILEFGCNYGYMTKYLKENLKCEVHIVEKDIIAGQEASQFATKCLIGDDLGDINNFKWTSNLLEEKYDYVIFADVLEHLVNPAEVILKAKSFLNQDGSMWISIPNISYNGVILDMLNDNFSYRDFGILDKTHLRFFTYNSLTKLVNDCGLRVIEECNLINALDNSEFKNCEMQSEEIFDFLKKRKYGEVYQFVWSLKPMNYKFSIIIPVLNKLNFTKSAVNDLLKLEKGLAEIIIVDNGSTDGTDKWCKEMTVVHSNIKYIRNDINAGFGKASNQGYSISIGENIIFLNNDIRVQKKEVDWIKEFLKSIDGDNLCSPTGGLVDSKDFSFKYEVNAPTDKEFNYLSGWCLAGSRKTFDKLKLPGCNGPFDDQTFFVFFEDTDLSFRAKELNIGLQLIPVDVVHFKHQTAKELNINKLYTESKAKFYRKYRK